jgi:histidinol-phosphate aminotransferase
MPRQIFSGFSRRSFLQLSSAASAAAALHIVTEPLLAQAQRRPHAINAGNAVMIDSNENPLGPSQKAREAVASLIAEGGRYHDELTEELINTFAQSEGLSPDQVRLYPGSSGPLHHTVLAYTSPSRSYVTADPGYEAGMHAATAAGARIVKVPLTKTYAHDVRAMLSAASDAGVFYICTPNNPTGTLTSHSDVEYLLDNKPKDSIVLVDEAYIHFSHASSVVDLVKAGKDVIVLRTFSKLYGMAGLRCGAAIARPDLLQHMESFAGWIAMPVTAVAAASASLKDPQLVAERRSINTQNRQATFDWLDRNGYSYIPSESNCFLLDAKRPAKQVIEAMAQQNVMIGRIWPVMPTHVRITVGTRPEMEVFQAAFKRVMDGTVVANSALLPRDKKIRLDGVVLRA